jgi:arsenate reductase
LLDEHGVDYEYRDYKKDPLSASEVRSLVANLGLPPRELLRKRDRAYLELGLDGTEAEEELISHLSSHPTLLERPIGIAGERAVLGRPPERLLVLVGP